MKSLQYDELSKELNIPGSVIQLDAIQVNRPAQVSEGKFLQYDELSKELNIPGSVI